MLAYTVTTFRDGLGRIVWNDDEHWIGNGSSRSAALAAATQKIFALREARAAVQSWLAARTAERPTTTSPRPAARRIVLPARPLDSSGPGETTAALAALPPAPATPVRRRAPASAAIRAKLGAGRALFVSNREDPELRERVAEAFQLDVEWCVADPRRLDAACARIARGAFDVVLSATGFHDHATDVALARAAKGAGTRYVRVNRGRVVACERALLRELGLQGPADDRARVS